MSLTEKTVQEIAGERELKFRVWNGEEMISPDYITRDGWAHWKENSIPTSSKEVMQYSGFKDIDGVEVYEGDICEFYQDPDESLFFHGLAYYLADRVGGSWKIIRCDNEGGEEWGIDSTSFWNDNFKVIGNYFANPSLLAGEAIS